MHTTTAKTRNDDRDRSLTYLGFAVLAVQALPKPSLGAGTENLIAFCNFVLWLASFQSFALAGVQAWKNPASARTFIHDLWGGGLGLFSIGLSLRGLAFLQKYLPSGVNDHLHAPSAAWHIFLVGGSVFLAVGLMFFILERLRARYRRHRSP